MSLENTNGGAIDGGAKFPIQLSQDEFVGGRVATASAFDDAPRKTKKLWVDTFSDPVCHFGAPWQPFWILQAVRRCRW